MPPIASHCSFCSLSAETVDTLVAGPGVFICNDCVDLCGEVIKDKREIVPDQPRRDRTDIRVRESVDDDGLLVDDDLRGWVGEERRRGLSWDRIGVALGMRRQSAWERFG